MYKEMLLARLDYLTVCHCRSKCGEGREGGRGEERGREGGGGNDGGVVEKGEGELGISYSRKV